MGATCFCRTVGDSLGRFLDLANCPEPCVQLGLSMFPGHGFGESSAPSLSSAPSPLFNNIRALRIQNLARFLHRPRAKSGDLGFCSHLAVAQKTGIPKWLALASGNMDQKTCGLPLRSFNFEPNPFGAVVYLESPGSPNQILVHDPMSLEGNQKESHHFGGPRKDTPIFLVGTSKSGRFQWSFHQLINF